MLQRSAISAFHIKIKILQQYWPIDLTELHRMATKHRHSKNNAATCLRHTYFITESICSIRHRDKCSESFISKTACVCVRFFYTNFRNWLFSCMYINLSVCSLMIGQFMQNDRFLNSSSHHRYHSIEFHFIPVISLCQLHIFTNSALDQMQTYVSTWYRMCCHFFFCLFSNLIFFIFIEDEIRIQFYLLFCCVYLRHRCSVTLEKC